MDPIAIIMALLITIVGPIVGIVFVIKRKVPSSGQPIGLLGPRRRDGILTYNDYWGRRYNVEVEAPQEGHSPRYQHRHVARKRQQTKPWMK